MQKKYRKDKPETDWLPTWSGWGKDGRKLIGMRREQCFLECAFLCSFNSENHNKVLHTPQNKLIIKIKQWKGTISNK